MDLQRALDFVGNEQHGILITQKGNGRPQSSNIGFHLGDDGVIRISVSDGRAKTANLRRTGTASLHVNRADFWAYAVVEADVTLTPVAQDPNDATVDALVDLYRALSGEHEDWDEYRAAMVSDHRLVVELRPTYAYGMLGT